MVKLRNELPQLDDGAPNVTAWLDSLRDIEGIQAERVRDAVDHVGAHPLLSRALGEAGFEVVRVKLEHESIPSLATFDQQHYHEVHVKLSIPHREFDDAYKQLKAMGDKYHFVPSRNPLDTDSNEQGGEVYGAWRFKII